jgi:hypothetical protein
VDLTQCPQVNPTECTGGPTTCPTQLLTECPSETECPLEFTVCPKNQTQCGGAILQTYCPTYTQNITECSSGQPTICPHDPAICQPLPPGTGN